jgi:hypothetical protein
MSLPNLLNMVNRVRSVVIYEREIQLLSSFKGWYSGPLSHRICAFCAGAGTASVEATLEMLNQVVDGCIDVAGGISSQYFYRSMYAVQLHHCFKVRHW